MYMDDSAISCTRLFPNASYVLQWQSFYQKFYADCLGVSIGAVTIQKIVCHGHTVGSAGVSRRRTLDRTAPSNDSIEVIFVNHKSAVNRNLQSVGDADSCSKSAMEGAVNAMLITVPTQGINTITATSTPSPFISPPRPRGENVVASASIPPESVDISSHGESTSWNGASWSTYFLVTGQAFKEVQVRIEG